MGWKEKASRKKIDSYIRRHKKTCADKLKFKIGSKMRKKSMLRENYLWNKLEEEIDNLANIMGVELTHEL